jgi:hypothetical protein
MSLEKKGKNALCSSGTPLRSLLAQSSKWIVLRRCGREALFLPDFVEKAVASGTCATTNGQKLLLALRSRLPVGFVEHSLRRLEGVL